MYDDFFFLVLFSLVVQWFYWTYERKEGRKCFIYDYMVSDILLRATQKAREETCCHHYMGF